MLLVMTLSQPVKFKPCIELQYRVQQDFTPFMSLLLNAWAVTDHHDWMTSRLDTARQFPVRRVRRRWA